MKIKIILEILVILIIILMMPSISAVHSNSMDKINESIEKLKTNFLEDLDDLPRDVPPQWFTFFYILIMLSLDARILVITPLAITYTGEYMGSFEVNSYFFFLILLTLVYRFAFWFKFFERISEKNNWELP